ncbi:unnamed protein product [Ectocarpus fasciculatus]
MGLYYNIIIHIVHAGAPGSGKSTLSNDLLAAIPDSVVVPMDGFHYYREELDKFEDPVEAHRRRGAHWTFNAEKFVSCVSEARRSECGVFPSFDHAAKDPKENSIEVKPSHKVVIVEGLYLLLDTPPWNSIKDLLDVTIFLDCPEEELKRRLVKRHMASMGLSAEEALDRVVGSDLINAIEVMACNDRADCVICGDMLSV